MSILMDEAFEEDRAVLRKTRNINARNLAGIAR